MTWLRPCTSKSRFVGPYYLKENLRQLWSQPTRALMQWYLQFWFELALESRITQFIAVAKTSRACAKGILNYCSHEISTGKLERMNNKIQTLKRKTYSFCNEALFILILYSLYQSKAALSSVLKNMNLPNEPELRFRTITPLAYLFIMIISSV